MVTNGTTRMVARMLTPVLFLAAAGTGYAAFRSISDEGPTAPWLFPVALVLLLAAGAAGQAGFGWTARPHRGGHTGWDTSTPGQDPPDPAA